MLLDIARKNICGPMASDGSSRAICAMLIFTLFSFGAGSLPMTGVSPARLLAASYSLSCSFNPPMAPFESLHVGHVAFHRPHARQRLVIQEYFKFNGIHQRFPPRQAIVVNSLPEICPAARCGFSSRQPSPAWSSSFPAHGGEVLPHQHQHRVVHTAHDVVTLQPVSRAICPTRPNGLWAGSVYPFNSRSVFFGSDWALSGSSPLPI